MCPFKKAFPLVLFLHLLFAVGIFASFAQHDAPRIFTLLPALGVGESLQPGPTHATVAQAAPAPKFSAPQLAEVKQPHAPAAAPQEKQAETPAPQVQSSPSKFFHATPAAVDAPAGGIAANSPSRTVRVGSDMGQTDSLGGSLTPPIALKKQKPTRPARQSQGEVILHFTINEQGMAENVSIENSPSPEMTAAVMAVLPKWRFAPAQQDGKVIPLRVRQVVKF